MPCPLFVVVVLVLFPFFCSYDHVLCDEWVPGARAGGLAVGAGGGGGAPEPYPYLQGGSFVGPAVEDSPDPLVTYKWDAGVNQTQLQIYDAYPISVNASPASSFLSILSLLSSPSSWSSSSSSSPPPSTNVTVQGNGDIMMDFGVERASWLEFDSPDLILNQNSYVTMSISEYNQPAIVNAGPPHPVKTNTPAQYKGSSFSTFRLELNPELYEGVRFGWIHVQNFTKPWHIIGVRAVSQIKPTNYTGALDTSNPIINRIWYTGAYTVKVNLLSQGFGSILMDRGDRISWTGDAHTSQACALVAFSNYDFIKQNIDRTSSLSNGIESYSLYWILSLLDYYWYTGDVAYLTSYALNVVLKITHAIQIYGTNPSLGFYGHDVRTGCCFENPSCTENQNAYKMLVLRILIEFSSAMGLIGQPSLQEKYMGIYNQFVSALRNSSHDGAPWFSSFGIHACADAVNANFTTQEEQEEIYKQVFTDPLQLVSYAPFNQYFLISALGRMSGGMDAALLAVDLSWGGQLRLGATTFWEVYSSQWSSLMQPHDPPVNGQNGYSSMCHPWAGGVTRWLSENVLGIRPTSPGFKTYTIKPYISELHNLTKVSGTVDTPQGPIIMKYDFHLGTMEVTSPPGTTCLIGIPNKAIGHVIYKITHSNQVIYPTGEDNNDVSNEDYVFLRDVRPGHHIYRIHYIKEEELLEKKSSNNEGEASGFKEGTYAASFLGNDTTTQGDWNSKYGKLGYYLIAAHGPSSPVASLPSYVQSLSWTTDSGVGNPRFSNYGMNMSLSSDVRALSDPTSQYKTRSLGVIATQDPSACMQTVHINILLSSPKIYSLSLYFVDFDHQQRHMVVELYDLATLNIITPYMSLSAFDNGIYMRYEYNNSVQVRLSQVRGGDAVMSGIFFD
eukprot:TRINITY_DN4805_c0_g1_i1.p1 TRINITY_DN4805_c0_g1~~TRINITY_DN4805_c0_g1_i1.p1  ORF type:complete len:897 (+),score=108.01 TRINITY_DN4805_c0_g1_i1:22-2712(+)